MDQLVPELWENPSLGLKKELITFQYQSMVKASELSSCFVTFKDVHLPPGRDSNYLKDVNGNTHIKLGHALTPIDWYIEKFLQVMLTGEESKCTIRTTADTEISFTIHMERIDFGGYYHEQSLTQMLTLAKIYKENGVKMFKQYPPQFAHYYFTKAARCLLAYMPFGDIEERAHLENIDVNELQPLLENIYTNIAACLLKESRNDEIINVLSFVNHSEQPSEKAVYRLAVAYSNKKEYEKARDVIKKLDNYTENKDLMALFTKINQESKVGDEKYASMVKKMFQ